MVLIDCKKSESLTLGYLKNNLPLIPVGLEGGVKLPIRLPKLGTEGKEYRKGIDWWGYSYNFMIIK